MNNYLNQTEMTIELDLNQNKSPFNFEIAYNVSIKYN